jgi:hypothetical protein
MAKPQTIQTGPGEIAAMKRLCVLLCALIGVVAFCGCASEGHKGQWDDFWKDVRGDNMQMKTDFSAYNK